MYVTSVVLKLLREKKKKKNNPIDNIIKVKEEYYNMSHI